MKMKQLAFDETGHCD